LVELALDAVPDPDQTEDADVPKETSRSRGNEDNKDDEANAAEDGRHWLVGLAGSHETPFEAEAEIVTTSRGTRGDEISLFVKEHSVHAQGPTFGRLLGVRLSSGRSG
jgi:hypothetical protein